MLVFDLRGQLAAYKLFLFRSDLLSKFKCSKPVLQVHPHIQRKDRFGTLQEVLLCDVVLEQDAGNVADQNVDLCFVLDRLNGVDHSDVLAHLEGDLGCLQLNVLEALSSNHLVEL